MKSISFFSDQIEIIPHTATNEWHLRRVVTVAEFANGEPVSLYELGNDQLLLRTADGRRFIEGRPSARYRG